MEHAEENVRKEWEKADLPGDSQNHAGLDYQEYFPGLYRFACRLLGNGSDAQDVVQEAFLSLLTKGNTTNIRNRRAWLFRTTTNACYDRLRSRGFFQKIAGSWLAQRPEQTSPEQELQVKNEAQRVRAALNRLPEKKRIILLLHQEGLSYAEIAQAAGLRKSSLGKLLARATRQLAKELAEGEKDGMPVRK
jgi:RNA polymerase sigma-70 factor (ECF subfamily)